MTLAFNPILLFNYAQIKNLSRNLKVDEASDAGQASAADGLQTRDQETYD